MLNRARALPGSCLRPHARGDDGDMHSAAGAGRACHSPRGGRSDMELRLTCAECAAQWVVERWTPGALACPACGSPRLGDNRSRLEEDQRIARKKALERRRAAE